MLEWNGEQIMAAFLEAIIEGGNEIQAIAVAEAQARVGYQSGELRSAIEVKQPMTLLADGSIEGRWGVSGVDHAFADEFGTRTRFGKGGLRLGMARAGLQAQQIIGARFYQKAAQYRK